MPIDYPSDYERYRKKILHAEESLESGKTESLIWRLLSAAAESPQSWVGLLHGADYVVGREGTNPKSMENFFKRVLQKDPGSEWMQLAHYTGDALDKPPKTIISAVRDVAGQVPTRSFRELANLDKVKWCLENFGDNPERLRECLTSI